MMSWPNFDTELVVRYM